MTRLRRSLGASTAIAACVAAALAAAPAAAVTPGLNGALTWSGPPTSGAELEVLSADTGTTSLSKGQGTGAAWSSDGTRITFVSDRDDSSGDVYVATIGSPLAPKRLTTYDGLDEAPVWSPDGTRLAFVSSSPEHNELFLMNPDGTGPTRLHPTSFSEVRGIPDFSPDGARIVVAGLDGLVVFPATGGPGTPLTGSDTDAEPSWSPDGARIAFSSRRAGSSDIWVVDAAGNTPPQRLTTTGTQDEADPSWSPDGSRIAFTAPVPIGPGMTAEGIATMTPEGSDISPAVIRGFAPAWRPVRPAPTLAALSPASAAAGSAGATITAAGTGFIRGTRLRWNGADRPTAVVSPTSLTAQITAADLAVAGTARVSIVTPAPAGGSSAVIAFAVTGGGGGGVQGTLTLTRVTAAGAWKVSRLRRGAVRIAGTSPRAANLRVAIAGNGGRNTTRTARVPAGAFALRVPLGPTSLPGALRIAVSEPAPPAGLAALTAAARATLAAPREGVVSRAFVTTAVGGAGLARVPAGRFFQLFAYFRFAAKPAAGLPLSATWRLRGFHRTFPLTRPAGGLGFSTLGSTRGGHLASGPWQVTLRAGRAIVARAGIVIG